MDDQRIAAKFAACVPTPGPIVDSPCLIWQGHVNRDGYGVVHIKRVKYLAHRVAYADRCGPIEPKMMCCHHCDTPSCVNPDHIFLGTQKDNIGDCVRKGRHGSTTKRESRPKGNSHWTRQKPDGVPRGESSGTSKLTEEKVRAIRSDLSKNNREMGEIMGVSHRTISSVRLGRIWKHVL